MHNISSTQVDSKEKAITLLSEIDYLIGEWELILINNWYYFQKQNDAYVFIKYANSKENN